MICPFRFAVSIDDKSFEVLDYSGLAVVCPSAVEFWPKLLLMALLSLVYIHRQRCGNEDKLVAFVISGVDDLSQNVHWMSRCWLV